MELYVAGVGVLAPGLNGWGPSREILSARTCYLPQPIEIPTPTILPAVERRRSSLTVRLAIAVAQEAITHAGIHGAEVATVFATSDGDGPITHLICEALAQPERHVSPTAFHNSVYNAPAGYWSIGVQSRKPSTTICAYDHSVAAGLLEAAALTTTEQQPVLLVALDVPFPPPLHRLRATESPFAIALLFTPALDDRAIMRWTMQIDQASPSTPAPSCLPSVLLTNPVAKSLPLLSVLASERDECIVLDYVDGLSLTIDCRAVRSQ